MEEIICRQNAAARPASGRTLVAGVSSIVLRLALAQIAVHLLIRLTGMTALYALFYICVVWHLARFLHRMVRGCIYTLKTGTLVLQRLSGDETTLEIKIPTARIVSVRPVVYGERLSLDYRHVRYIDTRCKPGLRMQAAFALSLVHAGLARLAAGRKARRYCGVAVVFAEQGKRRACVFRPDRAFLDALRDACPQAYAVDERRICSPLKTYAARSLRHAFPDLYPHVEDIVSEQETRWADEEFARREEMWKERRRWFFGLPVIRQVTAVVVWPFRALFALLTLLWRAVRALLAKISGLFAFLRPISGGIRTAIDLLTAPDEEEEIPYDAPAKREPADAPRRRRKRQE